MSRNFEYLFSSGSDGINDGMLKNLRNLIRVPVSLAEVYSGRILSM